MERLSFQEKGNRKTQIPTSKSSRSTCPSICPLIGKCYPEGGYQKMWWDRVDRAGMLFVAFIAYLRRFLGVDQIWRHNEAGDLVKRKGSEKINRTKTLAVLSIARPFTYTHHDVLGESSTAQWNRDTISTVHAKTRAVINLSANDPRHADDLLDI